MENALTVNFNKNTPWVNSEYTVYRYNDVSADFDSIGYSTRDYYIDEGLINGKEYCYRVRSKGSYSVDGILNPLINFSQENCEEAIDTTAPCTPIFDVVSNCDSVSFYANWEYNDTCYDDVKEYRIYFTPYLDDSYQLVYTANANMREFVYTPESGMAGCFYVTAVDSFQNESSPSVKVCLDDCTYYILPNVFTPNDDGINDLFQPIPPYYFVEKIDIQIFNRWGLLMFETEDPDINWDGRYYKNGKLVSDGVYYYICDVYEQRLTGIEVRHLHGFIHVFTSKNENQVRE
jgi:gliding motility-associated-like protein